MPIVEFSVSCAVRAAASVASSRVLETAAMFGLGVDRQRTLTIIPHRTISIRIPGIAFITGPSGGGKSTLLRMLREQCAQRGLQPLELSGLDPPDASTPIVDAVGATLERAHGFLARVGLADAFALLRRPAELSDGQRYRFEMARLIERAEALAAAGCSAALIVDEFGALLDRATANTIARNLRKWIDSTNHLLICATTHDDLLESLQPDVLIWKGLGAEMEICSRDDSVKQ
jgi:uncharacterized protein